MVDNVGKRSTRVACEILAHPVKDDDRIVHREADDREHGSDEESINLYPEECSSNSEEANRHDDVVEEGG